MFCVNRVLPTGRRGMHGTEATIQNRCYHWESGRHPDIEAIAFANDMMALGGYREIKRRGLEVGRDIAITGFDDFVLSGSMEPPLTTVRVSAYQLGATAFRQALKAAKGEKVQDCEINSELVVRGSCGSLVNENQKIGQRKRLKSTACEKFAYSILHNSENRVINRQIEEICGRLESRREGIHL